MEWAAITQANDPGMKTTAMIEDLMNQGGMNAAIAKKLAEKRKKPRAKSGNPVKIQVDGLNPNNFSIAK